MDKMVESNKFPLTGIQIYGMSASDTTTHGVMTTVHQPRTLKKSK